MGAFTNNPPVCTHQYTQQRQITFLSFYFLSANFPFRSFLRSHVVLFFVCVGSLSPPLSCDIHSIPSIRAIDPTSRLSLTSRRTKLINDASLLDPLCAAPDVKEHNSMDRVRGKAMVYKSGCGCYSNSGCCFFSLSPRRQSPHPLCRRQRR